MRSCSPSGYLRPGGWGESKKRTEFSPFFAAEVPVSLAIRKKRAVKPQRGDVGIAPYAENKKPGQQVGGQKTEGQAMRRLSLCVL